jgi:hypothetical protein
MPKFIRQHEVVSRVNQFTDVTLLDCHKFAPLISHVVDIRSTEFGDEQGWIEPRYLTTGSIALTLGPIADAMHLTREKIGEVLEALLSHGLIERSDSGAMRTSWYQETIVSHNASVTRAGNSASQKKRRNNENSNLGNKCNDKAGQGMDLVAQGADLVSPGDEQVGPADLHDAPAGSLLVQDSHYLGIPSGCSKKEGEGEGEGGVGEGEPVRLPPPRLALVPPEPAPPPLPKGHRRPKPPLRSREDTIDAAHRMLPDDPCHPMWQAFTKIMDSRWTLSGLEPRPCWEIPGFDTVRIAQKLGAPQYDSVPKEEILRACDRLEMDTKDTKSDLGLYLLGWFNRELKFKAERSARYGGAR